MWKEMWENMWLKGVQTANNTQNLKKGLIKIYQFDFYRLTVQKPYKFDK